MAEKIWIVIGQSGQYSDGEEWIVDAWRSEQAAQARVEQLERTLRELGADTMSMDAESVELLTGKMLKHDPEFVFGYPGSRYFFKSCELKP